MITTDLVGKTIQGCKEGYEGLDLKIDGEWISIENYNYDDGTYQGTNFNKAIKGDRK